jgi:flagellar operon protein
MVDRIKLQPTPVQGSKNPSQPNKPEAASSDSDGFEDILAAQLGRSPAVRFSNHAQKRLVSRGIDFDKDDAIRLEEAVEKAASKGARESLILMDDLALVVSIKNRVVITAVDQNSRKENIFTNIDTVVLT